MSLFRWSLKFASVIVFLGTGLVQADHLAIENGVKLRCGSWGCSKIYVGATGQFYTVYQNRILPVPSNVASAILEQPDYQGNRVASHKERARRFYAKYPPSKVPVESFVDTSSPEPAPNNEGIHVQGGFPKKPRPIAIEPRRADASRGHLSSTTPEVRSVAQVNCGPSRDGYTVEVRPHEKTAQVFFKGKLIRSFNNCGVLVGGSFDGGVQCIQPDSEKNNPIISDRIGILKEGTRATLTVKGTSLEIACRIAAEAPQDALILLNRRVTEAMCKLQDGTLKNGIGELSDPYPEEVAKGLKTIETIHKLIDDGTIVDGDDLQISLGLFIEADAEPQPKMGNYVLRHVSIHPHRAVPSEQEMRAFFGRLKRTNVETDPEKVKRSREERRMKCEIMKALAVYGGLGWSNRADFKSEFEGPVKASYESLLELAREGYRPIYPIQYIDIAERGDTGQDRLPRFVKKRSDAAGVEILKIPYGTTKEQLMTVFTNH